MEMAPNRKNTWKKYHMYSGKCGLDTGLVAAGYVGWRFEALPTGVQTYTDTFPGMFPVNKDNKKSAKKAMLFFSWYLDLEHCWEWKVDWNIISFYQCIQILS